MAGVAACGSSNKQLSLSQFAAKGDAICQRGNAQRNAIPQPNADPTTAGPAQLKQIAAYLDKTSASLTSELQQIRALGTPQTGGSVLGVALAIGDRNVATQKAAAQAAAKGDVAGFRSAFAALSKLEPATMLRSLGFKVCG